MAVLPIVPRVSGSSSGGGSGGGFCYCCVLCLDISRPGVACTIDDWQQSQVLSGVLFNT